MKRQQTETSSLSMTADLVYLHHCSLWGGFQPNTHGGAWYIQSSPETRKATGDQRGSSVFLRKELVCKGGILAFVVAALRTHPMATWLWWPGSASVHKFKETVAKTTKESILFWLLPWGSVWREHPEMPIPQSTIERGVSACFQNSFLRDCFQRAWY